MRNKKTLLFIALALTTTCCMIAGGINQPIGLLQLHDGPKIVNKESIKYVIQVDESELDNLIEIKNIAIKQINPTPGKEQVTVIGDFPTLSKAQFFCETLRAHHIHKPHVMAIVNGQLITLSDLEKMGPNLIVNN